MHDAWSSHEVWVYECLACETTWNEEFEARHSDDGHGGEAVVYEHDGHLCMTPWTDHVCPGCRSNNVKVFSTPPGKHGPVPKARRSNDLELMFRLRRLHAW